MTNGCFDLLHAGHILTLETARTFGNVLIVAVNSDLSVKRLKGPERPLNKEDDRARVLAALSCVDAVVIFPEDTAENILSLVKPDIYAKGGDCVLDEIPERKVVESFGGKIIITPFLPGRSTTNLIDAFRQ
jgi:rfaE bifunctional protein nucleotidyltransferase chain/domain